MQIRHYLILFFTLVGTLAMIVAAPRSDSAELPEAGMQFFSTPTPLFTPTPLPTATLPSTPSPTPAAPGCEFGSFDIPIGSTVTVRPGVNIRATPSISGPWVANFAENLNFTVEEGPVCANGYQWWKIRGHGIVGWVAERDNSRDFIRFIFEPESEVSGCQVPLEIAAGDVIEVIGGVRIRKDPGLSGLVLTVAPVDTPVTFLNGDVRCVDGYNWRLVEVTVANYTYIGWMAEGSANVADLVYVAFPTIDPDAVCNRPLNLRMGERRRVRYVDGLPKSLRAAPGPDSELLYTLVNGVPFEIVGGPVCAAGMNYWQVRILSNIPATGWYPEGPRPNYWSEPFVSSNAYPPTR